MTAEGVIEGRPARVAPLTSAVVPLLALAVTIQYVDRGNIATAAPLIKQELGLNAAQIGILVSAFYWAYSPGQLLTGWLAHRLNAYRTLALGLALWSAATLFSGVVGSFALLLALRLVLGFGESAFFPCYSRIAAQWIPTERQGAVGGLIGVGMALGPAAGTWIGGNLMAVAGWRASFLALGALSLLWLIPWLSRARPLDRPERAEPGPPAPSYWRILRRRDLQGAAIGQFFNNYSFYFLISWMPLYLVQARGYSMGDMAGTVSAIYLVYAASCWASGALADVWIRAGASSNLVRKTMMVGSSFVAGVALLAGGQGGSTLTLAGLVVAAVGCGMGTPNLFAAAQTLAGPSAGGKWMALQNGFANLAGIVGPMITGVIIDATGGFRWAFASAGAVGLLGVLAWGFWVRKIEPLAWETM